VGRIILHRIGNWGDRYPSSPGLDATGDGPVQEGHM